MKSRIQSWAGRADAFVGWSSASALMERRSPGVADASAPIEGTSEVPSGRSALRRAVALAFVTSLSLFALLTPEGLPNGDAAVYAQQVAEKNWGDRPVHMAYYVLGSVATFFRADFADRWMNLLSALFAAGTVALVVHIAGFATGRILLGLAAGGVLLGHLSFVRNAVWAEVYAPQTFFVILAFWLFWRSRSVLAGLALAIAVLITPSSLFAVPALLLSRPQWRAVVMLGISGSLLTLGAIAPVWREYFWGDRGLLKASGSRISLGDMVVKEGFEVVYGFGCLWPFLALGAWAAFRRLELRPYLLALLALWGTTFVLGERFSDVPVQLPTWTLAAPLVALGLGLAVERLAKTSARLRWMVLVAGLPLAAVPLLVLPFVRQRSASFAELPTWVGGLGLGILLAGALVGGSLSALGSSRPANVASRRSLVAFVLACLLANGAITYGLVHHGNLAIDGYRHGVLELGTAPAHGKEATADGGGPLAIGGWSRGILFEHYLFRASYTEHWINTAWLRGEWGAAELADSEARWSAGLGAGREILLLTADASIEESLAEAGYREAVSLEVPGRDPIRSFVRAASEGPIPDAGSDFSGEEHHE